MPAIQNFLKCNPIIHISASLKPNSKNALRIEIYLIDQERLPRKPGDDHIDAVQSFTAELGKELGLHFGQGFDNEKYNRPVPYIAAEVTLEQFKEIITPKLLAPLAQLTHAQDRSKA